MNERDQRTDVLTGAERIGIACAGMMAALLFGACVAGSIAFLGTLGAMVIGVAVGGVAAGAGLHWFSGATGLGQLFGITTGILLAATGLFGIFPSLDHTNGLAILVGALLLAAAAMAMLTDVTPGKARRAVGVLMGLIALALLQRIFSVEHTWFDS
ncbi:hypothetical protein [Kribbella deserti]|uniref:DUF4203 domain-containing protein n=1 Tax=Kribbella deserti TaxID=1926257 RepID=A0ABV6QG19_9ACTN